MVAEPERRLDRGCARRRAAIITCAHPALRGPLGPERPHRLRRPEKGDAAISMVRNYGVTTRVDPVVPDVFVVASEVPAVWSLT
jgi:hypothetical protein